jgi:tetratricopeptide (TPR) repeat protein
MAATHEQRTSRLIGAALILGTLLAYGRVLTCGFTNFDDPNYITENSHVSSGLSAGNLAWAFTTGHASNWHPLTWISHMVDCQIFGLHAAGHHAVNLLFHLANTLLLFGILKRMTGAIWRSAAVAALFAWHPLHVESVAWLSERKDVLSAFFWLLTMRAYLRYVEEFKVHSPKFKACYVMALVWFVCGLMSKPMVVTLPFVLILLDYWPLRRILSSGEAGTPAPGTVSFRRALLEKAPMLALALIASLITFFVQQHGGAVRSLESLPFQERAANALVSYVRYMGDLFWPRDLAVFYPFPGHIAGWQWGGAAALLAVVTLGAFSLRRRHPFLITGWLWYLGTLVPVIGLVQVGTQAMADRYTYLPSIGWFIALAWGAGEAVQRLPRTKLPVLAAGGAALVACLALTVVQTGYWKNSRTLFSHAIAVTKDNTLAHVNLGEAYDKEGNAELAKAEFMKALQINPESASTLNGLGEVLAHGGDTANAVKYFDSALSRRPFFGDAHYNLGNVFAATGDYVQAAAHYAEAVRAKPDSPDAHNNLGAMLVKMGRWDDAANEFKTALRLNPNFPEAEDELGGVLAKLGQTDAARQHYAVAVRLKPDFAHAQNRLGFMLAKSGRIDLAIPHLLKATVLEPTNSVAFRDLAAAYAGQGELDKAVAAYKDASRLDTNDASARSLMGGVLMAQGNHEAAIEAFRDALRLNPDLPGALRNLAWILATCPKPELRNGAEAVRLAEHVNHLSPQPDPRMLEALDVALAEAGRFDDAIKTAEQVRQLAGADGDANTAKRAAQRLELYRAGKPFHE